MLGRRGVVGDVGGTRPRGVDAGVEAGGFIQCTELGVVHVVVDGAVDDINIDISIVVSDTFGNIIVITLPFRSLSLLLLLRSLRRRFDLLVLLLIQLGHLFNDVIVLRLHLVLKVSASSPLLSSSHSVGVRER